MLAPQTKRLSSERGAAEQESGGSVCVGGGWIREFWVEMQVARGWFWGLDRVMHVLSSI